MIVSGERVFQTNRFENMIDDIVIEKHVLIGMVQVCLQE